MRTRSAVLAMVLCLPSYSANAASWRDAKPLPSPRWFHAGAATPDGQVFAFGGFVKDGGRREFGTKQFSIDIFDPDEGTWRRGPEVPGYRVRGVREHPRRDLGGATSWVTESGESTGDPPPYETPNGAADLRGRVYWFGRIAPVYYDSLGAKWDQTPSAVHHTRQGTRPGAPPPYWEGTIAKYDRFSAATAAAPDGRIYLVGGMGTQTGERGRNEMLDSVEIYDPETNGWSEAPPLTKKRQQHAAVFGKDGKLYVFGGCACRGGYSWNGDEYSQRDDLLEQLEQRRSVKDVEVYDPVVKAWALRTPMPTPRQLLAAALGADGKIYVIGGSEAYGSPGMDLVQVYDPSTDQWSEGPPLHIGRYGHAAATTPDGRIWVIGGMATSAGALNPLRLIPNEAMRGGPLASVEVLETRADNERKFFTPRSRRP